jgi:hypothetical protein
MAHRIETTVDGWMVEDIRGFEIMRDHLPPRPHSYWRQIRQDFREPKIIRMWVTGFGFTAAAIATGWWPLLVLGVPPLLLWARLCRSTVRLVRTCQVASGVVEALEPHPLIPNILAVGQAVLSSGEQVNVGVQVHLAREMEREGLPAEVLLMVDPTWQHQVVFAARPARYRQA